MADFRRRGPTRNNDGKPTFANGSRIQEITDDNDDEDVKEDLDDKTPGYTPRGLHIADIFRILAGILLLNFALSFFITGNSLLWGYTPWWSRWGVIRVKLVLSPPPAHT
jgi:hypothetical protein